jgi:hypothetical protein
MEQSAARVNSRMLNITTESMSEIASNSKGGNSAPPPSRTPANQRSGIIAAWIAHERGHLDDEHKSCTVLAVARRFSG